MPLPTPFHTRTSELCTSLRWKDWSGWFAVCSYGECHEREYQALRQGCGLIDVAPLFKYDVTGPDAAAFLSAVCVRDVTKLAVGRVTYLCWCDDDGKLVDDGTVTRLDETRYRLTAAEPSLAWLERQRRGFDVAIEDVGERIAALAVQGPTAREVVRQVCDADVDELRFFRAAATSFEGGASGWITRTGYTGDLGYELWFDAAAALGVYDAVLAAGRDRGLRPVGLDALDVARVEAGFVMSGVDYEPATHCTVEHKKSSPFEVGLGWTVQLERESFRGRDALRAERERGSKKALAGLEIDVFAIERLYDRWGLAMHVPAGTRRDSVPVYDGGRQVGYATSRAFSPTLKRYIALATLAAPYAGVGRELEIEVTVEHERRRVPARVVERPFFDPARKRA